MRNYLSFGGGVNSVALYLYLRDMGTEFEAVFVDHGGDYPGTYDYVKMFSEKYPLTILKAVVHRKKINKSNSIHISFIRFKNSQRYDWPFGISKQIYDL